MHTQVYIGLLFFQLLVQTTCQAQGFLVDSCLNALKTLPQDTNRLNVLNFLIGKLGESGQIQEAIRLSNEAIPLADKLNAPMKKANAYHYLGAVYRMDSNYPEALRNFLAALKIREACNDSLGIARSYNVIGTVYQSQKEYDLAENYLSKAVQRLRAYPDLKTLAGALANLGGLYASQKKYDKAFKLFSESLDIYMQRKDKLNAAVVYYNLGSLFNDQDKWEEALNYHRKGYELSLNTGNPVLLSNGAVRLGFTYSKLQQADSARYYLLKGKKIAQDTALFEDVMEASQHLSVLYDNEGKYEEALLHYKEYYRIRDSLYNQSTEKKILALQMNHDFEKKEALYRAEFLRSQDSAKVASERRQLELVRITQLNALKYEYEKKQVAARTTKEREKLKQEEALKRLNIEYEHRQKETALMSERKQQELIFKARQKEHESKALQQRNIFLFLLVILGILAFWFFTYYRNMQQKKRKEEIDFMKQRISRDLHDDIGSTLSTISRYAELASNQLDGKGNISGIMNTVSEVSREMLSRMNDIVWSINPGNNKLEHLINRLRNLCASVLAAERVKHQISVSDELLSLQLNSIQLKEIYLIAKEAINNSLKYSQCSRIALSFTGNQDKLLLEISDDGIGFDTGKISNDWGGNGLLNMKERAREMFAKVDIWSQQNKGCIIKLEVPMQRT